MHKEIQLNSLMREEACAAPQCVETQVQEGQERYAELGAFLNAHPPANGVTIARGSSDHAASYLSYLCAARGGHLVSSLPMSLVTVYRAPIATRGVLAIAISQSGRSPDLAAPIEMF